MTNKNSPHKINTKDNPEAIIARFKELETLTNNPFNFQVKLLQIAQELELSLEETQQLWERYCQGNPEFSSSSKWLEQSLDYIKQLGKSIVFLGQFSLLFGVIIFILDAEKREKSSRNQSWQVINNIDPEKINASAGRIEALESLNKGCEEENNPPLGMGQDFWQTWRHLPLTKGFYADCINLNKLNLQGANLSPIKLPWSQLKEVILIEANLENANLQGAELQQSILSKVRLSRANLQGADLSNADLVEAKISGTKLRDANLFQADLTGADLTGADLRGTNLINADLTGANLTRVVFDRQTQPFEKIRDYLPQQGAYFLDVKQKTQADLAKADLRQVDLSETNLEEANLRQANLGQANLQKSNLFNGIFQRANLRGTNFEGAKLNENSQFNQAIYDQAMEKTFPIKWREMLRKTAYKVEEKAQLGQADLEKADLSGANLQGSDLTGANLSQADLRRADLSEADLTGANLSSALYDVGTRFPEKFRTMFKQSAYNLDVGSQLNQANLEGLNLENANLVEANLQRANLQGANLRRGLLFKAQLQEANLEGANLVSANLEQANFEKTNLKQANLEGANLQGAIGLTP
ncbi:MAG: pentapeptide repeat-containing protein, partial [Cyanobacteria bacterium P01_G01_bin.49]